MNRRYLVVPPNRILPVHPIRRPGDLRIIVRELKEHGWTGRRLLVERIGPNAFQAWTGTHRLAGARRVHVSVPVLTVDLKKWVKTYGVPKGAAIDETESDEDRYVKLLKAGDRLAADLMRQEIELNASGDAQDFV